MDMEKDIFATCSYGQLALKQLAPVCPNFRLYSAGWLGERPEEWTVMEIKGAEFRAAKTGAHKGKLSIMVKGSQRTAFVTRADIQRYEADATAASEPMGM